ncbi:lytic transglycosylase domain-containing protein [Chelativorans sp. M5D2P16]|uniref:lytic transglycosylase domain-containing protein n=1 Tax=Chelativorans sp. M5D2P16 TaxID=3095678 RepID=UPI002ACAF8D3|nr:lytic transglycosylase domain-containing protein [Chelativorans sp. M5D2P16]MDZ5698106.1 lytic transglycosylase domain-containing protein [Chelativorans sp. M5D2P16]
MLTAVPAAAEKLERTALIDRVCNLIESHAKRNALPADFLARLIWKESRFDPNAVSPKGAEGIAQFMPGTAALRGLKDAFDIGQAIPASAAYLADLAKKYGNLGLAAAAYNAGEGRVSRWLSAGGFLPLETEDFVLDILGEPADRFAEGTHSHTIPPLKPHTPFDEACRDLPASGAVTIAMANVPVKPWGIQVAGHFRRDVAVRQWERLRTRHQALLAGHEPVVSRMRSPRGRRGIYAVRIGANSRADADEICGRLRGAGGSCIVLRNR